MFSETRIIGHLGDDPELTGDGDRSRAYMSVAVGRRWRSRDGQDREETTWYPVVVWGAQARACAQHLTKGSRVHVAGRMRQYRSGDEQSRKWELAADRVTFLSPRPSSLPTWNKEHGPSAGVPLSDDRGRR